MSMQFVVARTRATILFNSLLFLICPAVTHALGPASPMPAYFSWQFTGPETCTADVGSIHGSVLLTKPGNDVLEPRPLSFTAPDFIAQYGTTLPTIATTNGVGGSAADALAQFTFDKPLPPGARLLVFDVDVTRFNERYELSHIGGVLNLYGQLEGNVGRSSNFPIWYSLTGVLQSQGSRSDNDYEATVFDISGVTAITARFLRNSGGGGIAGAHLAIAIPVPEPAAACLLAGAAIALTRGSRKHKALKNQPQTHVAIVLRASFDAKNRVSAVRSKPSMPLARVVFNTPSPVRYCSQPRHLIASAHHLDARSQRLLAL